MWIASWAKKELGVEATIESQRLGKRVDVELVLDGRAIAIEVALSTAWVHRGDQELRNVRGDLEAGYDAVAVICPKTSEVRNLRKRIAEELEKGEMEKVHVELLRQKQVGDLLRKLWRNRCAGE